MNRSRVINAVGAAIGVVGIAFVVRRVVRDRHEIAAAIGSANLAWLVVGFSTGLAAMVLIGVNWLSIIRRSGTPAPWRRGLSWYFVGQLGKYVPGGIWPIVGQAELAHRSATPRATAYTSTAMSMVATFLGAASVAAIAGIIAPAGTRLVPVLLGVGVVALLVVLAAPPAREVLHRSAARVTRRDLRLPGASWFTVLVARHLPVWVLFSGMNVFAVVALGETLDARLVTELIYATSVSWMAGFVVVGVPGGIGVRETVFLSLMTAPLGSGVAVSVAVLSRVVSIVVDLAGAGISIPVSRTAPPLTRVTARCGPGEPDTPSSYAAP